MTSIILYGDKKDLTINSKLRRTLSRYGGVLHVTGPSISDYGCDIPEFVLFDLEDLRNIQLNHAILIFKSRQKIEPATISLSDGVVAVVEPENKEALALLRESNAVALTCGMSGRSTLTISSIDETSAVISLQRETKTLNGILIEPSEIRVSLSERMEGYVLLAICAVCILSGKIERGILSI